MTRPPHLRLRDRLGVAILHLLDRARPTPGSSLDDLAAEPRWERPALPGPWVFSAHSIAQLETVHPVLQRLLREALPTSPVDFRVHEGHRGREAQNAAHARGTSGLRWPQSHHNRVPSLAVDVVPVIDGELSWDWEHYHPLAAHIRATWASLPAEVRRPWALTWGGEWRRPDGPHWQIDPIT